MCVISKGQVTIPQAIREQAGLHPNCDVQFLLVGEQVRLDGQHGNGRGTGGFLRAVGCDHRRSPMAALEH